MKQYGQAYVMKMKSNSDIKVASRDKALNTFKKLCTENSKFNDNFKKYINIHNNKLNNNFRNNKMTKKDWNNLYDAFNKSIPSLWQNQNTKELRDSFINELKKSGYDAIQDINDMKYSGYSTKTPLIIFDKNKMSISSMDKINDNNLWLKNIVQTTKGTSRYKAEQFVSKYGGATIAATTSAALTARQINAKQYENTKKNIKKNTNKIKKIYKYI